MPGMSLKLPKSIAARLAAFGRDQSGATTVEWVILTASCLSLSIGLSTLVGNGVEKSAMNTSQAMEDMVIASTFDSGSDSGDSGDSGGKASDQKATGKKANGKNKDKSSDKSRGKSKKSAGKKGGVSPGMMPSGAPGSVFGSKSK